MLLGNSTYLIASALLKQRRLIQTKVHFKFCYSVRIKTTHKPSKVAAAQKVFSNVYVIDATCFDECFLFHVVTGRYYFWQKFFVTLRSFQQPFVAFFQTSVLKQVRILRISSPQWSAGNGEVLIPKFQNKAIVY